MGTPGTFTVTTTGISPPATLSEPAHVAHGVTFNAATGVLSGTPATGTAGAYPLTFTATNNVAPPPIRHPVLHADRRRRRRRPADGHAPEPDQRPGGGTSVTIFGTNLADPTGVLFGTTAATASRRTTDNSITATSPAGTAGSTVDVTVTTLSGTSATSAADQFKYTLRAFNFYGRA